jgi:hypothetical protein
MRLLVSYLLERDVLFESLSTGEGAPLRFRIDRLEQDADNPRPAPQCIKNTTSGISSLSACEVIPDAHEEEAQNPRPSYSLSLSPYFCTNENLVFQNVYVHHGDVCSAEIGEDVDLGIFVRPD